MARISERSKMVYLIILILAILGSGAFWLDYIGMFNFHSLVNRYMKEPESVMTASGDEPSLIMREEFEKEKDRLQERIEKLDRREALISEKEKELETEEEKLEEIKKGIELEKKKFQEEKERYSGYQKNVQVLAEKMANMPPEQSVEIMVQWEDPLIIDVLRQMDQNAAEAGQASITPYLITLMPKEKASRIMYLMTQI